VNRISKVRSPHRSDYPDPLRLKVGQRVTIGDKVSEWPGWLWCTEEAGKSGWVPEAYVRREGDTGWLVVEYDATELSAAEGDQVEVLMQESGWAWCRKSSGDEGWLPLEVFGP
jgi:uncharacterized protein YgiM (DUF1202 family)